MILRKAMAKVNHNNASPHEGIVAAILEVCKVSAQLVNGNANLLTPGLFFHRFLLNSSKIKLKIFSKLKDFFPKLRNPGIFSDLGKHIF